MAGDKDIHWNEGMFVQPHHFQQAFQGVSYLLSGVMDDFFALPAGVKKISLSDGDCENFTISIKELDVRLPDHTKITFPGNCFIESRNFKQALDANQGRLEVFLALPNITDLEPNTLRFNQEPIGGVKYRFVTKIGEVNDLSTGSNTRQVEFSYKNPKIIFSGESTFDYTMLKIAEISRSQKYGSTPQYNPNYVPPCIDVFASKLLTNIYKEIGNKLVAKNRTLRSFWDSRTTSSTMKTKEALKVQSVATITNQFIQLQSLPQIHPFDVYLKLVELIGLLSIYSDNEAMVSPPIYDHNNLGECFLKVDTQISHLFSILEEVSFESKTFELVNKLLQCEIGDRWASGKYDFYIRFDSKKSSQEVKKLVAELKIAPLAIMPSLNLRRIRGVDLDGPVHHIPMLPASPDYHYFKVSRESNIMKHFSSEPKLAIWGAHEFSELTTLFFLENKKG